MRTYSGFRASYRHYLKRHGLEVHNINLHRYRHTFATMLLEMGINPKIVQNLLGHSDISTTIGVYSHVVSEVFEGVAVQIGVAFDDMTNNNYTPRLGNRDVENLIEVLGIELQNSA